MANLTRKRTSIALTTFNGERYLHEQLQSFSRQTYLPDELVVCDDGSTDDTLALLRRFSERAPFPVKVTENEGNLGYARNFERAILATSGDIVFLSDQDDVWHEEKIERMIHVFEEDPGCFLAIHDLEFCDESLQPVGETKLHRMSRYADPMQSYVTGMATAVRADFAAMVFPLPTDVPVAHDDWLHRCAEVLGAKRILPEVLASYRRHEANVTAEGALNRPTHSSQLGLLSNQWKLKPVERLQRNWSIHRALTAWVLNHQGALKSEGTMFERALLVLNRRKAATEARIRILSKNRFRRVPAVIANIFTGTYRHFSGVKSALKDLFAPTETQE